MNWPSELSQFSLQKNKKLLQVRAQFNQGLQLQTNNKQVAYYDFLLVAKQMGLRFQQAKHLMSLKAYFVQNNNSIQKQKLCNLLMVKKGSSKDKYIVKFALPHHISPLPPIQQQQQQSQEKYKQGVFQQSINTAFLKKKQLLVNMKMIQIQRVVHELSKMRSQPEQKLKDHLKNSNMNVQQIDFRIIISQINKHYNIKEVLESIKGIYFSRINENLIRNVMVLQKKTGPQLLQVIQPNLVNMQLQSSIINSKEEPKRKPVLAPIKLIKRKQNLKQFSKQNSKSKHQTNQNFINHIQKISKIINENKQVKRYDFDTNANRLRRLFVQQIIIPFEKKNDEEVKKRYPKPNINLEVNSQRIL